MMITIAELRKMIRRVLRESPGVTADPTEVKGFYPYETERGVDVHGYWYKSPGDKGSNDPGRPEDPEEYIGLKPKESTPATTSSSAATPKSENRDYTFRK